MGEDRPHKISPKEKWELASKAVRFWQLRDLCSEKRDRNAKVCTRALFSLVQSSLWPLPDWDTCQMTVLQCWDCKPSAFKSLVRLDGKLQAKWKINRLNNFRIRLQMHWLDMWICTSPCAEACVQGQLYNRSSPNEHFSKLKQSFFTWALIQAVLYLVTGWG